MSNIDPATGQRYDLDTWARCASNEAGEAGATEFVVVAAGGM